MRAVVIHRHGGPEVLEPAEVQIPHPARGEALIKVRAVSVNAFLDGANRAGRVPFARYKFPHILGSEHAGEVAGYGADTPETIPLGSSVAVHNAVACGSCRPCAQGRAESCTNLELIGVTRPGAYAEYSVAPVDNLRVLPPGLPLTDAAAMSVNGPLATVQLMDARARPGDTVLIQGAASATGTMVAVVARAMGCQVLGTSRSHDKIDQLRRLEIFDGLYDSTSPDVLDEIRTASGGGVDIVIDNVGSAELWKLTMAALGPLGRVACSGAMFGGRVELDVAQLYRNSQQIIGVRSANEASRDTFWDLVERHQLRPVIDSVYPLAQVADAHRRLETLANVGRVVVSID